MLRIGITGGIGSGKTTICKLFELQQIPVFYADMEAKKAMNTDTVLMDQLRSVFGNAVYSADGSLNRSKLAAIVFNNDTELEKLNAIVHPAVFRLFDQWVEKQQSSYVVKEAALLFESKSYLDCQAIILVKSPKSLKLTRVIKRDASTEDAVLKRMNKQMNDDEKEKLSDFVIQNNELQLLIPQVMRLHNEFLKRAQEIK